MDKWSAVICAILVFLIAAVASDENTKAPCENVECTLPYVQKSKGQECFCFCNRTNEKCLEDEACNYCGPNSSGCKKENGGKIVSCLCKGKTEDLGGFCGDKFCKGTKCIYPFRATNVDGTCKCVCHNIDSNGKCSEDPACKSCGKDSTGCLKEPVSEKEEEDDSASATCICKENFRDDKGVCKSVCDGFSCENGFDPIAVDGKCKCYCSLTKNQEKCRKTCSACGNAATGCKPGENDDQISCDCQTGYQDRGGFCADEKCQNLDCMNPFKPILRDGKCGCYCNVTTDENDLCFQNCGCGPGSEGCKGKVEGSPEKLECFCKKGMYDKDGKCAQDPCESIVLCQEHFVKKRQGDSCFCSCIIEDEPACNSTCDCGPGSLGCRLDKTEKKTCMCKPTHKVQNGKCKECDCGSHGECNFDENGVKKCSCDTGFSDKNGKCIECDCGSHGECNFNEKGVKKCSCDTGFSDKNGECIECDCGPNGKCSFDKKGEKKCMCDTKYANKKGTCEKCDCGPNGKCSFDGNGEKKCNCDKGYADKKGTCTDCKCGEKATTCDILDDGKFCYCEHGFAYNGSTCAVCNCGKNGNCVFDKNGKKKCSCDRGYGDKDGTCTECKCGDKAKGCTFKNAITTCDCDDGYLENNGKCEECMCGSGTCSFDENGKKVCNCERGFGVKNGTCVDCGCGNQASGCTFHQNNTKTCNCEGNYADLSGVCSECFCGPQGKGCRFERENKVCSCNDGYAFDGNICNECNCGPNGKCSFKGGIKLCDCNNGFGIRDGKCESCGCGRYTITCNFEDDRKTCICEDRFAYNGSKCAACDCGALTKKCEFIENEKGLEKWCSCRSGSSYKDGQCTECNCGDHGLGCKFTHSGKICDCKPNSAQLKDKCVKCECGETGEDCEFTPKGKICKCKADHAQKGAKCEKCECGPNSKGCSYKDNIKTCNCNDNYAQKGETCVECKCGTFGTGCEFKGEVKHCKCQKGYADRNSNCESCTLPKNVPCTDGECAFSGESTVCQCKHNYTFIDGICKLKRPCSLKPCVNGTCVEKDNLDYECVCKEGFSGKHCDKITWCEEYGESLCPGNCIYDEKQKIGSCNCTENQYFNILERKCESISKCSFIICGANQTCDPSNGKCKCEDGYVKQGSLCVYDACKKCGPNEVCHENKRDPKNPLCTCKDGFYYDGKTCTKAICDIPKASPCSQVCVDTDNGYRCDCFPGFKLEKDGRTCNITDAKTCDLECKTNSNLKGQCILGNDQKKTCKCPPGYYPLEGKCIVNAEKICPDARFNETTGTCICEKTLKLSKNGITCERAKLCDEKANIEYCEKLNGFCVDTDKGFECKCRGGMKPDEKKVCKSLCDLPSNECRSLNKECEVILKDGQYETECKCPLAFDQTNDQCNSLAKNSYLISTLPISKTKYPGNPNTDVTLRAKLLKDLDVSLKLAFPDLEDVSLVSCIESGKELLCKLELQFEKEQKSDLSKRLQSPNVCVPDKKSTDLCLVPPELLLKKSDLQNVKKVHTEFCTEDVKDKYCGKLAKCSKNQCTCGDGFRTVFSHPVGGAQAAVCEDIDECAGHNKCSNTTKCVNSVGSYYCECKPGHKKPKEKDGHNQESCIDLCAENICGEGTCAKSGDFMVDCTCKPGFSGSFCGKQDKNLKGAKHQVVVVASVLGVLLALSLVALFVLYRRFRQNRYSQDFTPSPRNTESAEMMERRTLRQGVTNRGYQ